MVGKIELEECLRDSPRFRFVKLSESKQNLILFVRSLLEEEEASVDQLEQKLDKILKVCGTMVDSGKTYVAQQRFAN
jgi:Arf-GAP/coiled-coil/ANK repeat/PH domain-containing protein